MGAHVFKVLFLVKEEKYNQQICSFPYLLVLHKVSNDISNIDHFVSIHISYRTI